MRRERGGRELGGEEGGEEGERREVSSEGGVR